MNSNFGQSHLSLRDYFAAQAMNTLLHIHPLTSVRADANSISRASYVIADLMLLAKEGKLDAK